MLLKELLDITINKKASDLHLTVGTPPVIRVNGELSVLDYNKLSAEDTERYAKEILGESYDKYKEEGEIDTSYSIGGIGRFRVNIFTQRNSTAIAIRVIPLKVSTLDELNHPKVLKSLVEKKRGLVVVTGPTGSGKSTTLAAMINEINATRSSHIVTLEEPIEYLHKHNKSIINQREIGKDTKNYRTALKSALREDPDVILIGEMRDLETISIAITAAETGHLVLSTLHTIGAAKTIDRIIDVFPQHQLQGIVSQQLLPRKDENGRISALEIMVATPAIQSLIREGKTHQIESLIQTGSKYGMKTMDMALVELYKNNTISEETLYTYAVDKDMVSRLVLL